VSSADAIWRRAQVERQAMIFKRATRPLIFMRRLSVGCVVVLSLWLLLGLTRVDYRGWVHGWAGTGAVTAAVGMAIAMACVVAGVFYLLNADKGRGILGGA